MGDVRIQQRQDRIRELEKDISKARKELAQLKRGQARERIGKYAFSDGNGSSIYLSDLFGDKNEMIVIHNMGKGCPYCTLWADGFNGVVQHLENRAAFVVISPDDPAVLKDFRTSRDWKFRMVSGKGTTFIKDMGFENGENDYMPGFSVLCKDEAGNIYRTAHDYFGPGDPYSGIWHLFDLLPNGVNNWHPKFKYQ